MEQSPSGEANRFVTSQEFPHVLWNPNVHYRIRLSISWASSIQSVRSHHTSWNSILILPSHLLLGLPSGPFPSGYPTKTLYTPLLSHMSTKYPAHLILIDQITWIVVWKFRNQILLQWVVSNKLVDHPVSVVRNCLFNIFAATLHVYFQQWLSYFADWTIHFQIIVKERPTKCIFEVNQIFRISILLLQIRNM
jgi:hypothetical protein